MGFMSRLQGEGHSPTERAERDQGQRAKETDLGM